MLKEVEYAGDYEEPDYDWEENPIEGWHYPCCSICGSTESEEHKQDCNLAMLIKQTESMLK